MCVVLLCVGVVVVERVNSKVGLKQKCVERQRKNIHTAESIHIVNVCILCFVINSNGIYLLRGKPYGIP